MKLTKLPIAIFLATAIFCSLANAQTQSQTVPHGGDDAAVSGEVVLPRDPIASVSSSGTLQSVSEHAIDWLDKQISPPSADGTTSGSSYFSDPAKKRSMVKTGATLTLVLSVFLTLIFLMKLKPSGKKRKGIPEDVLSVLGKIPFVQNQQLQLIRLGSRLLLVSTSPAGSQTLGEISDPDEVCQIEAACRDGRLSHLADALRRRTQSPVASQPSGISLGSHQRGGNTLLEA